MSITYPLSMPSVSASTVKVTAQDAVAIVASAFTFQSQAQQWPGQLLSFDIQLPSMKRTDAEKWTTFLTAMMGQYGTCLFQDPSYKGAQGVATGTPLVNFANNAHSQTLSTKGWTHSVTGILKAGDYISVGTGTTTRLYKVLTDANSDGFGVSTLDIYPSLRESLSDGATITLVNPKGTFRLSSNIRSWSIDTALIYGISFSLVESF